MSLLSNAQARPETLRSMVSLFQILNRELSAEEVLSFLAPEPSGLRRALSAAEQSLSAAKGLGLFSEVEGTGKKTYRLQGRFLLEQEGFFSDWLHRHLVEMKNEDKDFRLLFVYAWFVVRCDQEQSTKWIRELNVDSLADQCKIQMDIDFNSTQYRSWRLWMIYIGLGWEGIQKSSFVPHLAERLYRELKSLVSAGELPETCAPDEFLSCISKCMPYVDRGMLFQEALIRCRYSSKSDKQISYLLSAALRELEEEGQIELTRAKGDADTAGALKLAYDSRDPGNSLVKKIKILSFRGTY